MIAFVTSDLVFPSRVAGVAQRLGAKLLTAGTIAALAPNLEPPPSVMVALLDLNSPGVDPTVVVPWFKGLPTPPKAIVAFGPHVHKAKLEAAQAAGCDYVLSRGQFDAQMDKLLEELLAD